MAFPDVVIYEDSCGMWDGLEWEDNSVKFYTLNERYRNMAIKKALERFKTNSDGGSRSN